MYTPLGKESLLGEFKYKAFISYSHKDKYWALWLHRRLETYTFPQHTIGKQTAFGPVPKNLKPIFRDRDELAAADDLGKKIESALSQSENLIIICSPAAAASHWVNQEILYFKRHNRGAKIFSIIIEGESFAMGLSGQEAKECLPPALRFQIDEAGDLTNTPAEPLAADLRPLGDGKRLGLLKLISGIAGLGLDDLVQRDLQRARRRVTAITAGAISAVLVMGSLTWFALDARQEAETRRAEAEGLIEFMLTDLRGKLEPVGRLDVLGDVASQALGYYEKQDATKDGCNSISSIARAHYLKARIHVSREELETAKAESDKALFSMQENLQKCSTEPRFIINYIHAQQWIAQTKLKELDAVINEGAISTDDSRIIEILSILNTAKATISKLEVIPDTQLNYAIILADAELLIGGLYSRLEDTQKAKLSIDNAFSVLQRYRPVAPVATEFSKLSAVGKRDIRKKYADVLSWRSEISEDQNRIQDAIKINREAAVLYSLLAEGREGFSEDWNAKFLVIGGEYSYARLQYRQNKYRIAFDILDQISYDMKLLLLNDPTNNEWKAFDERITRTKSKIKPKLTNEGN